MNENERQSLLYCGSIDRSIRLSVSHSFILFLTLLVPFDTATQSSQQTDRSAVGSHQLPPHTHHGRHDDILSCV